MSMHESLHAGAGHYESGRQHKYVFLKTGLKFTKKLFDSTIIFY
jgi:hypothetical protein